MIINRIYETQNFMSL